MYKIGMIEVEGLRFGDSYLLTGEAFQNLLLWRPRVGEAFTVCGSDKRAFRARVTRLGTGEVEILVFERLDGPVESDLRITLLQALPEKERMELIIQKATELGVSLIVPFKSKRSISLEEREAKQKKSHKWGEIALKAARQSRRATIPEVLPYCGFADALHMILDDELRVLLWEKEKTAYLKETLQGMKGVNSIVVMVGPEGGFEEAEVEEAKRSGFIPVGLGERILRTETAAIIMVGLIQYEMGNLG